VKPVVKIGGKKKAFTIVELMTVMSVIIILIGLLVPALNMVRRVAMKVQQKNQFHAIEVAQETFNVEWDGYPPSKDDGDYCGAMKLCEAMMGQDLLGFHPSSRFRKDGTIDGTPATQLYPTNPSEDNLKTRVGPYLKLDQANAYRLEDLYYSYGPYDSRSFVLCDVYKKVTHRTNANLVGMPVLYYRADTGNTEHPTDNASIGSADNIYHYQDNNALAALGMPWETLPASGGPQHNLVTNPLDYFYEKIKNEKITTTARPYRSDSYILLSAGFDGEYGTPDDIYNFSRR